MPLTHLLKNKILLQKGDIHLNERDIDEYPYWLFEENIKIINKMIEEDGEATSNSVGEQSMPKMPNVGDYMKSAESITSGFKNFKI